MKKCNQIISGQNVVIQSADREAGALWANLGLQAGPGQPFNYGHICIYFDNRVEFLDVQNRPPGSAKRYQKNLTAAATEVWCKFVEDNVIAIKRLAFSLITDNQNDRTRRIAAFAAFYPTPYLPFPKDFRLETLTVWIREIADLFIKLHDIKFTFADPQLPQQLKLNSLYYGLRDAFGQVAPDLREELLPEELCQLYAFEEEEV